MRAKGFRPQPRHGSSAIAATADGFDDGHSLHQFTGGFFLDSRRPRPFGTFLLPVRNSRLDEASTITQTGVEWFGDGTHEGLQRAKSRWELRPNVQRLNDALGVLSGGQLMFLAAMVSFYNSDEGGAMLNRCQFKGLADLGGLDLDRRKAIADLLLHYHGW